MSRGPRTFVGSRFSRTRASIAPACLAIGWLTLGCDALPPAEEGGQPAASAPAISVYAASYPVAYFADRIGGDRVTVEFPVPVGEDPATWSPAPEVVLGFQQADLILLNGADYEDWVATATLPAARLVDTSAPLAEEIIVVEDGLTHSHGPEGEHSHTVTASELWLDLDLAIRQAGVVRDAFAGAEPESAAAFGERFAALERDLRALDGELTRVSGSAQGRTLLAAGAGYTYLARGYGLELAAVSFDPTDPASHDFWHEVEHAVADGAGPLMLWPAEPSDEVRSRLDGMGIEAVVFDPGGARPAQGDFLTVMAGNAERLETALGGG